MNVPKMDIYSTMLIPFHVSAYCREHRYCVEAVELARALRDKDAAETKIMAAQREADAAEARMAAAVKATLDKMRKEGAL